MKNIKLISVGIYEMPQGHKAYTHDEAKKILSSLNNIPGTCKKLREQIKESRKDN